MKRSAFIQIHPYVIVFKQKKTRVARVGQFHYSSEPSVSHVCILYQQYMLCWFPPQRFLSQNMKSQNSKFSVPFVKSELLSANDLTPFMKCAFLYYEAYSLFHAARTPIPCCMQHVCGEYVAELVVNSTDSFLSKKNFKFKHCEFWGFLVKN